MPPLGVSLPGFWVLDLRVLGLQGLRVLGVEAWTSDFGLSRLLAQGLWDRIREFGVQASNRSHRRCGAWVTGTLDMMRKP